MELRHHPIVSAETAPHAGSAAPFLSREQILQATSRCLREHGYDNTTIRRIAGMLDCAVGSIYRYYTDKRDLLSAVTQDRLEPVAMLAATPGSFEASLRLYHEAVTQTPEMYRLMFWLAYLEPSSTGDRLPPVVRRIIDAWAVQLGGQTAAQRTWAVLHGMLLQGLSLDVIHPLINAVPPAPRMELPRVVVTMQDPPRRAAAPAEPVAATEPTETQPVAATDRTDDVCLL